MGLFDRVVTGAECRMDACRKIIAIGFALVSLNSYADELHDARAGVPFYACDKAAAIQMTSFALNGDRIEALAANKKNGCKKWLNSAQFEVVGGTATYGVVQVRITDRTNGKKSSGWTPMAHIDFAMNKDINMIQFPPQISTLACTTLEGALEIIPAKLRGQKGGAVVVGGYKKNKADTSQNYTCFTVPSNLLGIAHWETAHKGMVQVLLNDEFSSLVWLAVAR